MLHFCANRDEGASTLNKPVIGLPVEEPYEPLQSRLPLAE
jgi:hypothetical protein